MSRRREGQYEVLVDGVEGEENGGIVMGGKGKRRVGGQGGR